MLTKYIGKFFINDREVFKVVTTDSYTTTFLICPLHPSFSSSNYRFAEEVLDTFIYPSKESLDEIKKAREITKEEFEERVFNFVKELLNMF